MTLDDDFSQKVYTRLAENNIYYEFDFKANKITFVYDNQMVSDTVDFDMDSLGYFMDEKNKKILGDFINCAIETRSKEQTLIEVTKDNVKRTYLVETFTRSELHENICGSIKKIINLSIDENKMKELHQYDELTGLPNRVSIVERLREILAEKSFVQIALLDVDYFKEINDIYGHIVGDTVLEQIAKALKGIVDPVGGEVGRVGGDEFVVACPIDHMPTNAEKRAFCLMLRDSLAELKNAKLSAKTISITMGAVLYPFDGVSYGELYDKLAKAIYRGKSKGRSCYVIYNDVMHKNIDVTKPLTVRNTDVTSVDISVFVGGLLNSLLVRPTHDAAIAKMVTIASYLRVDRISIYRHKENKLENEYTWCNIDPDRPTITINNFKEFYESSPEDEFFVNDVFEFKRKKISNSVVVPYDNGAFVMVPVGIGRSSDLYFCVEIFDAKKVWHKYELSQIKIISRILIDFYLKD